MTSSFNLSSNYVVSLACSYARYSLWNDVANSAMITAVPEGVR